MSVAPPPAYQTWPPQPYPPAPQPPRRRWPAVAATAAGAAIVGGHTVTNPEPFYGLSVTGLIEPARVMRKGGARPGDLLFLTKPLGTGIITNNVVEFRDHWRSMLPVEELFDFVVDSSEVGMRKPNPAIFEKALEIGGLAPEEVVFLDDFEGNVIAASALNIRSILVGSDSGKTIADLDEILGLNRANTL